jgi:flagellum-specific ATP synthase
VLSDGDERDPVSDAARALLDGHVQLSEELAQAGRFPAVDVLASASRTMRSVVTPEHWAASIAVRAAIAALARSADARSLGFEPAEDSTRLAVAAEPQLERLLRQGQAPVEASAALEALAQTADMCGVGHEFQR